MRFILKNDIRIFRIFPCPVHDFPDIRRAFVIIQVLVGDSVIVVDMETFYPFSVESKELMHGMELVSRSGTSRRVFQSFPVSTGSKTGTAQREGTNPTTGLKYDDFAWFVSYAPADDPEVVVASVLFQGGTGSNAGPMARDLMAEYLGMNREEVKDSMPFENRLVE